jgi:DNA-binding FadR family transcriptional regulator
MIALANDSVRSTGIAGRRNLHGQIAEYLGMQILGGKLPPGETLPNEMALATSLDVSRTAIREAIKVLTSKGLIEVRRKTGTRVRPRREWNALDPDVLTWQFAGDGLPTGITDLLELRRVIEPAAAAIAAERARPENLREIEEALVDMKKSMGKTAVSVEADLQFHMAILEATHNSFMRPFGALIAAALKASFRLTNADDAAYKLSLRRHSAVFAAIRDRSPRQAEDAMLKILEGTRTDIQFALEKLPDSSAKGPLQKAKVKTAINTKKSLAI